MQYANTNVLLILLLCFSAPSPPPKKQKIEDDSELYIPNVLQGEIARLDHRFQVNLHDLYHTGSKTVHLKCKLSKYILIPGY